MMDNWVTVSCKECGKEFKFLPSQRSGSFCSIPCRRKGFHPSDEAKQKMSVAKLGKKWTEQRRKNQPLRVGPEHHFYVDGRWADKKFQKERCKKYREANREHRREIGKLWRLEHPDYGRQHREKNPLAYKAYSQKRIRLQNDLTKEVVQMVYEDNIKLNGTLTCCLCNKPIDFGKDSLEHKTPLCRGGDSSYANLGVSHRSCNYSKGKRTMEEYFNVCPKGALI